MPPELTLLTSAPETKFEFYSASLLKASTTPEGRKMLHGVASSTTKDLHGDTILRSALEDMERTAVGMTIFLNHSYAVPADVAGTVTKAIIKQDGVDQNHDPNYSLLFDIEVEDDNPEALRSWRYIQKGRKLGLSIGAMIPDGGAKRQKDGSYLIEHVNLLETSIVGIPANPKSWVEYAASALRGLAAKSKQTTNLGNPTLTLDADKGVYRIEGSLDGVQLGPIPS
jgi:HK97 family phage prohead protease